MEARVNVVFYWNSGLPGALNFIFANFLGLIMEYFIGIDIGTTNAKAIAMTAAGKILGEERAAYPSIQKLPGQFEQDPERIFRASMTMIPRLVTKLKSHKVAAIGLSSAMHGLIAVDKKGKPITNLITWADTRSASYAQDLRTTDLGKQIFFETCTPIHAMSPLSKLIWMRNELPKIWNSAGKFISMREYFFCPLENTWLIIQLLPQPACLILRPKNGITWRFRRQALMQVACQFLYPFCISKRVFQLRTRRNCGLVKKFHL